MMSPEVPPECGTVLNQALVGSKISYLINVCLGASTKFWTQSKTSNLMIVNSQLVFKTWCPDPALDWVQNILPDQQYFILQSAIESNIFYLIQDLKSQCIELMAPP